MQTSLERIPSISSMARSKHALSSEWQWQPEQIKPLDLQHEKSPAMEVTWLLTCPSLLCLVSTALTGMQHHTCRCAAVILGSDKEGRICLKE